MNIYCGVQPKKLVYDNIKYAESIASVKYSVH